MTEQSNNKLSDSQLNFFHQELKQHASTFHFHLQQSDSFSNPVIKGHFESHLEKVDEMYHQLKGRSEQSTKSNIGRVQANGKPTQQQLMLMLQQSIGGLQSKLNLIRQNVTKNSARKRAALYKDLGRILDNDKLRTGYLLR